MLPLFLLAAMSVTEFGWYYLHQHVLQYATREGMRVGLLGVTLEDEKQQHAHAGGIDYQSNQGSDFFSIGD